MNAGDIKYFIENKETHLWWYPEIDYQKPKFVTSFNGSRIRMPGHETKDMWTNDPFQAQAYDTKEEAQKAIDFYHVRMPDGTIEVTEHLFL